MIDIAKLKAPDVGRAVVYTPRVGRREDGVISSWNPSFVFVRYGADRTAKATDPADLEFLSQLKPWHAAHHDGRLLECGDRDCGNPEHYRDATVRR